MRKADVFMHGVKAGALQEADLGYVFTYDEAYLQRTDAEAITFVGQGFCSDKSKARFKGLIRDRSRCLHLAE